MSTEYTIISRMLEDGILKGFLIGSSDCLTKFVDLDTIIKVKNDIKYTNAKFDSTFKTLQGTYESLTNYPVITPNYNIVKNDGVVVLATIVDEDTNKPVGVVCFNGLGTKYNLSYKKLMSLCKNHKEINFKFISHPNYGTYVVRKDDMEFPTIKMKKQEKVSRVYNSAKGDIKPVVFGDNGTQNQVGVFNLDEIKGSDFSKGAQEKLFLASINMQKLTPYYHCCLQATSKKAAIGLGTCAVTEDTLFYDIEFIASLTVAELTFVLIHEICHLAQQHSIRGRGKDNELFNIACDLYINTLICKDFDIRFGDPEKDYGGGAVIKTPVDGMFLEKIGEVLDLAKDTPETIYNRLIQENQQYNSGGQSGNNGQQSGNQQNGQGQGQSSQSNSQNLQQGIKEVQEGSNNAQQQSGNTSKSQDASKQIQQGLNNIQNGSQNGNQEQVNKGLSQVESGINKMNDALDNSGNSDSDSKQQMSDGLQKIKSSLGQQGQQGQQGQGQGQQGQQGQGQQENNNLGDFNNTKADNSSDLGQNDSSNEQSLVKDVTVTYNGKKLSGKVNMDIMTNDATDSKESIDNNVNKSRDALQKIQTKKAMLEEELGEPLLKNAGYGAGLTQRYIEFGLSQSIDWRVLLRNMCKTKHKKTFTLANPNQDYMNMGMTIADRRAIGKPRKIGGIKICIDISGSVSKKELEVYLSEVNNIFTKFDVDGELIYWSTNIGDVGNFSTLKDLLKVKPISTGGTDVRCVFEYLNHEIKVNGSYERTKLSDITGIFIITDGCLKHNYSEYAFLGKKVVWLISGNAITFNPPFGRVLQF